MTEITKEEVDAAYNQGPISRALEKIGIDDDYLAKKLKRELNAKETKIIKVKGALKQEDLPKGFKIVATSGTVEHDKEGGTVFGDGETIIRYDPQALGIRQRSRQDAHNLKGDYPAEKVEHSGTIVYESNIPEPDPLPEDKK